MPDSSLHIRIDGDIKVKAAEALASIGMTTPEAVRSFLYRAATSPSFVHEMTIPNARVRAGMVETEETIKSRSSRFESEEDLVPNAVTRKAIRDLREGRVEHFENVEDAIRSLGL